jgi:hypothetical protein
VSTELKSTAAHTVRVGDRVGANFTFEKNCYRDEDGEDREISELEHYGEADGDNGGIVDDEPSLGSLDGRMSQLRWCAPDRGVLMPNADL